MALTPAQLKPTVDDVALLLRERTTGDTQGGLGGDTNMVAPTTFDDSTRPTADEVQRVINTAYGVVVPKLDGGIAALPLPEDGSDPPDDENGVIGSVRFAIALYAAVLVEVSFFGAGAADGHIVLWRDLHQENIDAANAATGGGGVIARKPGFGSLPITTSLSGARDPYANADPVPGIDF
jgi:hypothetical protein